MIAYFSCTPFISERRFFIDAVTSIADVRHIMRCVNLNDGYVTFITTSAYQTRKISRSFLNLVRAGARSLVDRS